MLQIQVFLAFLFCVLVFMHLVVGLKPSPTNPNEGFNITNSKNRTKRAVSKISDDNLWVNGTIRYKIESALEPHRCLIESAMMHIMMQSCISFQPIYEEPVFVPFLEIEKGEQEKCAASNGVTWFYLTGRGVVFLGADHCFNFGAILHELMHVPGFDHEHQRSDRDQYLLINYDNFANSSMLTSFDKNNRSSENFLTEFDIDSITLYGPDSGSKDRKLLNTMESKVSGKQVVSPFHKLSLSPLDVKSINSLYKCPLVDKNACRKLTQLDGYITNCSVEARKYIKLSLMKKMIDQCKQE